MSDATRNHDPATCRHLRTSLAFTMGSDVETCLDCGAWNAGSRKNGWHGAPSPSPRDPADDFVRGHAPRCPGIEGGVCDCGGPIEPDKWADLIMEGEAAGCYPCDTCSGFRAKGQPCMFCRGALGERKEQLARAREAGRREGIEDVEKALRTWSLTTSDRRDIFDVIEAVRSLSSRGETKGDKP